MTPDTFHDLIIGPALQLLPGRMDTPAARVMLLAIALQESNLQHRHQVGGPAHGWWQFEKGGGVRGVLKHRATIHLADGVCVELGYPRDEDAVYTAIEHCDLLAAVLARLNLWWLPEALATTQETGWLQYLEAWRPGKPHPEKWPSCWKAATEVVE